jgi:hypothetical protein
MLATTLLAALTGTVCLVLLVVLLWLAALATLLLILILIAHEHFSRLGIAPQREELCSPNHVPA